MEANTNSAPRSLRERLKTGLAVTKSNGNVSLKIPTIPGLGRAALKDMPPSNKDQNGFTRRLKRKCPKKPKSRPKRVNQLSSSRKLQNSRSSNCSQVLKPSRASYRLHLKTHSPTKKEKRINNTSISRTVEMVKYPFEVGDIKTKLLFMASLNLCPKPEVMIAPRVLVTPADPVVVEKIKVRQEKERKDWIRQRRKETQERMARLISIKNRGRLYPPKPIEVIDLASDDENKTSPRRASQLNQRNLRQPQPVVNGHLLSGMLQSSTPVVNRTNSNYRSYNLKPTKPVYSQNSHYGISNYYEDESPEIITVTPSTVISTGVISSDLVMNYDLSNKCQDVIDLDSEDDCPDFILGDLLNTSGTMTDDVVDLPPDGNNNHESLLFPDSSTDDINPQDFVAAHYGTNEEEIILID